MMSAKILPIKKAVEASSLLKTEGKILVLAGGCFDVLHPGHIVFLEKAKRAGDYLLVLLESDQKIRQLKGKGRPVHTQKERAKILSALSPVDFIVCLPFMTTDSSYDELILKIKPDIIAATRGDKGIVHKKRTAKKAGAKLVFVTNAIGKYSTSKILER